MMQGRAESDGREEDQMQAKYKMAADPKMRKEQIKVLLNSITKVLLLVLHGMC